MATDFAEAEKLVLDLLNASDAYGSASVTDMHPNGEVDAAITLADAMVVGAILATPGHPRRADYIFLDSSGKSTASGTAIMSSGDPIPSHLGSPGSVRIGNVTDGWFGATKLEPGEIDQIRYVMANMANTELWIDAALYFWIDNERLYFIGRKVSDSAQIDIAKFPANSMAMGAILFSPPEYFGVVVVHAVSVCAGKDASELEMMGTYAALSKAGFELIKMGAQSIPDLIPKKDSY